MQAEKRTRRAERTNPNDITLESLGLRGSVQKWNFIPTWKMTSSLRGQEETNLILYVWTFSIVKNQDREVARSSLWMWTAKLPQLKWNKVQSEPCRWQARPANWCRAAAATPFSSAARPPSAAGGASPPRQTQRPSRTASNPHTRDVIENVDKWGFSLFSHHLIMDLLQWALLHYKLQQFWQATKTNYEL